MFGNIHNSINLPRSYFEVQMGINYLMDIFKLFYFVANLSSIYGFSIDSIDWKKVILVTWWWKEIWLQYIKIGYTWNIIWLVGQRVSIILAMVANIIDKIIILKKLVILIFVVCLTGWLNIWINIQFIDGQHLLIQFWTIIFKYFIIIATIISINQGFTFCSYFYLEWFSLFQCYFYFCKEERKLCCIG